MSFAYGALTLFGGGFPSTLRLDTPVIPAVLYPVPDNRTGFRPLLAAIPLCYPARFRLFRVRSPLLTESLLFSFPAGT